MQTCSVCGKPTSDAPYRDHYRYFHLKVEEVYGRDYRAWHFCSATCLIVKMLTIYHIDTERVIDQLIEYCERNQT
jgi:hypothetical protein